MGGKAKSSLAPWHIHIETLRNISILYHAQYYVCISIGLHCTISLSKMAENGGKVSKLDGKHFKNVIPKKYGRNLHNQIPLQPVIIS